MAPRKQNKGKSGSRAASSTPAPVTVTAAAARKSSPKTAKKNGAASHIKPARYYAQIPEALRSRTKAEKQGLLSKFASSFLGRKPASAQVREFPFMTTAGPQYFCIDSKTLRAKFDVSHNDRLYYKNGPLAQTYCSVIGIRGGLLWVVNDVSKKSTESQRPDFIENDTTGSFDNGYATPLVGIENAKDLEEAGIEFQVKGGTLSRTDAVAEYPSTLVDFLRFAPDMTLTIPETGNKLKIPPVLTHTGEIGWSTVGAFEHFKAGGIVVPTEARALVTIVPLMLPVEFLPQQEENEEASETAEEAAEEEA